MEEEERLMTRAAFLAIMNGEKLTTRSLSRVWRVMLSRKPFEMIDTANQEEAAQFVAELRNNCQGQIMQ